MTTKTYGNTQRGAFDWVNELIEYRGLIYFFTWRYLKVRYKQTALGILWVAIQPLFLTAVVSLFIFRGLRIDFGYESVAIILPVYVGMVLWSYFDKTVNTMTDSLRSNRNIMAKIYFPKMIPPLSSLISGLVDLMFGLAILVLLILVTASAINFMGLAFVLLGLLLMLIATAGAGLLFAALTIEYRDIAQVMPFFFRIGIFVTPVIYPVTFLPESFHTYLFINPMAGVIELFRNGLFDPSMINWTGVAVSTFVSIALLLFGIIIFRRKEPNMIDVI